MKGAIVGDETLTDEQTTTARLAGEFLGWEFRDGWLCRTFVTPGFAHSLLLANQIGYAAEAAWHHPDLHIGYAKVTVKLRTHSAGGLTEKDWELARRIDEITCWKPAAGAALTGYPKNWVRPERKA